MIGQEIWGWDVQTAGRCLGSARVRENTGEGDAGDFCAQSGMGQRACRETTHTYKEWGFFGHRTDKALGVKGALDLLH